MTSRRDVRDTYDRIGSHFARTRPDPWPEVRDFVTERQGRVGLDVGVGNGRHAELLAGRVDRVLGLDVSRPVLGEAAARATERGFDLSLLLGDASALPVGDDCVDLAVYIATLHHLPTRALRIRSLDELERVLAPGGSALVSAWSTTHEAFDRTAGFDTAVDWTLPDGEVVPRYYHIYDPGEFRRDVEGSALSVAAVSVASGNCYAVVGPGEQ